MSLQRPVYIVPSQHRSLQTSHLPSAGARGWAAQGFRLPAQPFRLGLHGPESQLLTPDLISCPSSGVPARQVCFPSPSLLPLCRSCLSGMSPAWFASPQHPAGCPQVPVRGALPHTLSTRPLPPSRLCSASPRFQRRAWAGRPV